MGNKTFWQWLALLMYFVGVLANLAAWVTLHTWMSSWFMGTTIITWGVALGCVFFKPVKKKVADSEVAPVNERKPNLTEN